LNERLKSKCFGYIQSMERLNQIEPSDEFDIESERTRASESVAKVKSKGESRNERNRNEK